MTSSRAPHPFYFQWRAQRLDESGRQPGVHADFRLGLSAPTGISVLDDGFTPAGFVNIPHRQYWLAPETAAYLVRYSLWLACLSVLLCIGIEY